MLRLSSALPAVMSPNAREAHGKQTLVSANGKAYVIVAGPGSASISVSGAGGAIVTSAALQVENVPKTGSILLSPSSLKFTAIGSSYAQDVRIAQGSYGGTFSERDDCTKIATLAADRNGGGDGKYSVTPVGAGSCKATFMGGDGESASLPISVVALGGVVLKPSSLSFSATGSANSKTVAVTQAKYTGSFTESDDCAKIATLAATANGSGSASYTVTPVAAGSCNATFTGGDRESASLPISVFGSVVLSPGSLSFTAVSSSSTKTVTAKQANYTGSFDESDNCGNVATLSASKNSGGKATYTVTATGPGSCTAKIAGIGSSASLPISVTLPVPVIAVVCAQKADACVDGSATSPGSVQFTAVGDTATLTPSAPKWSHAPNFTLKSDTCNKTDDPAAGGNWAAFAPGVGQSASSFTVKAKNAGTSGNIAKCSATFSDAAGRTLVVNVEVTLGNVGVH
ncbi:MAG TPA: hypothetical protein VMH02_04610 [Verrucomicrobiae bacterium]|nr:hypothetical protein [Verrucomicrobiae bacterium]